MVHGLEGSGAAGYIRSLSTAALRAGFAAHRFHMRTCGGTEHLCRTLYHAGLTSDLLGGVARIPQGRPRTGISRRVFHWVGTWCSNSPARWGNRCADSVQGVCSLFRRRSIWRPARAASGSATIALYEARFVRAMRERLCAMGRYQKRDLAGLRSVFELDDRFTAPSFGFGDAANYYRTQSAVGYLAGLRVPSLSHTSQATTPSCPLRDL